MKTEMDVLRMDERQRHHWLEANRATLMFVGVVWLLMIAFELSEGRGAGFLIAMVPIFAGLRFGLYYYYARDRDIRWVQPALFVVLFALGHWVATAAAWAGELSTGGWLWLVPSEPSHGIWAGAARVLEFPIITLIGTDADLPEWLGAPAMLVNSLIWAGAAFLLLKVARGTRARRVAESGQKAPSGG